MNKKKLCLKLKNSCYYINFFLLRCEGYNEVVNKTLLTEPAYITLQSPPSYSKNVDTESRSARLRRSPSETGVRESKRSAYWGNGAYRLPRKSNAKSAQRTHPTTTPTIPRRNVLTTSQMYSDQLQDQMPPEEISNSDQKLPRPQIFPTPSPYEYNQLSQSNKIYINSFPTLLTAMSKESVLVGSPAALECMVSSYKYKNRIIWERIDENGRVHRGEDI